MRTIKLVQIVTFVSALCLTLRVLSSTLSLEVIQLQHRSAQEVIPILRPLIPQGGTLTGTGYQLIVRTTPENLQQLRDVLQRIDTAPRSLLITVRQSADDLGTRNEAEVSGHAQLGSGMSVGTAARGSGGASISYRDANTNVRTRVISTNSRSEGNDTQQIRVLEGHEALIQVGSSVPVLDQSVTVVGGTPVVQDQLAYKDVLRGFYVLPHVNGDQVTLDISPNRDTLSQEQGGAVDVQRLHTTVSGRLGEWIEIGGSGQQENHQDSAYTQSASTGNREQRHVWLKVEEVRE